MSWLSPDRAEILTLAFDLIGVPAPDDLPGVLLNLEGPPLGSLRFLLVEDCEHRANFQAVQDPLQAGPGAGSRLVGAAIDAPPEPRSAHPHICMSAIGAADTGGRPARCASVIPSITVPGCHQNKSRDRGLLEEK